MAKQQIKKEEKWQFISEFSKFSVLESKIIRYTAYNEYVFAFINVKLTRLFKQTKLTYLGVLLS